jgi:hypothetical protein
MAHIRTSSRYVSGKHSRCAILAVLSLLQGTTELCKAHGGGNRCKMEGCRKSAVGTTDCCIGHGGGDRCAHESCTKSAIGNTKLCKGHGGGKRCIQYGCAKSANSKHGQYCIAHGKARQAPVGIATGLHGKQQPLQTLPAPVVLPAPMAASTSSFREGNPGRE